jgi:arabinan endo-1,5-alpha-L-arabinosidase
VNSTYNIRVGRSPNPSGPFVDRDGVDLAAGGGTLFLETHGPRIGPGHAGLYSERGTNWFSCHYYEGDNGGRPALGLARLVWTPDGWPALAP